MATAYERALQAASRDTIDDAIRICEIPAPTFHERTRAAHVRDCFEAIGGWDDVQLDSIGNVVATRRGSAGRARTLVAAHLDTVHPDAETPVTRERGRLVGRGVGDNSVGVASLLAVGRALQTAAPRGVGDILLAANVGEEGRGDLRGIRRLVRDYEGAFDQVIAVEGLSLQRVQLSGVASTRYEVSVTTDGGHSWGAYGRENAISILARGITALDAIMPDPKARPKTTMNVGVISGGRSVNTIAPNAVFELDMRSDDVDLLARLDRAAKGAIRSAIGDDGTLRIRRIGQRPGGSIDREAPLIQAMLRARRASGLGTPDFSSGSTDANEPLSRGIPATCIGVTSGGEAHTPREWMRTGPVRRGVQYVGRAIANAGRIAR